MLTPDQIEAAWHEVKLSPWPLHSVELNRSVRHRFARAIEKAALEEAAVECDQIAESQGGDAGCANAIRALAKGENDASVDA